MATALSTGESASLYVLRRARTLAAPHQLRLVVTAFLALLTADLGRIALTDLRDGLSVPWLVLGAQALVYVSVALLLWREGPGLVAAASALVLGLFAGGTGSEPVLLLVSGLAVGVRGRPSRWTGFGAGAAAFTIVAVAMRPDRAAFPVLWFAGAAAVGLGVGIALHLVTGPRERAGRTLVEEAGEAARIRADERGLLARELHDVVTHHLSNVSLQAMSHRESEDTAELRRALTKVERAADSALTELRLLVRVLRDDPSTAPGTDEVDALRRRLAPTVAAAGWARRLVDAGFEPVFSLPAQVDRLETTVQATLSRALDVTCENVLRHAPARSQATVELSVNPTQVVFRAAGPLAGPERPRLGWGLRGLAERVDLSGGQFSAGPAQSVGGDAEWVVVVTLPRD